jgi:hypothetical protein
MLPFISSATGFRGTLVLTGTSANVAQPITSAGSALDRYIGGGSGTMGGTTTVITVPGPPTAGGGGAYYGYDPEFRDTLQRRKDREAGWPLTEEEEEDEELLAIVTTALHTLK